MRGRPSFLRFGILSSACCAVPLVVFAATSCGTSTTPPAPSVTLAPAILGPKGLIDQIATYTLTVYSADAASGGITCDATTGKLSSNASGATPLIGPVSNATMNGCGAGYTRCFVAESIAQSTVPRVFAVTGFSDAARTNPIAQGCATAMLFPTDAATTTQAVDISLVPILPKQTCGNGTLEPPETCDPPVQATDGGTTEECTSTCQTVEQLLSAGPDVNLSTSGTATGTGASGDKRTPSFVWPLGGDFLAFFADNEPMTEQISMRLLGSGLAPTDIFGLVAQTESLFLPNTPNAFPPAAEADHHKAPAAVQASTTVLASQVLTTYVAFAYDGTTSPGFQIVLRPIDLSLNALTSTPCLISDATTDPGNLTSPAAAVYTDASGNQTLFIAWEDDSGRIFGRTYTPNSMGTCGTLGTQHMLSTGSNNTHVSVAGLKANGWIAVWQSGSDVVVRAVDPTGAPSSAAPLPLEPANHTASTPSIASIASGASISGTSAGAFAIAWADKATGSAASTIYAQRYDSGGHSIDAATQISENSAGNGEFTPFVAASPAVTGSFVVTWVDQGSSDDQVRARLIAGTTGALSDGSAYLTNAIDGTTAEFQVSVATGRTRVNPTVAAGGGGYMAFGWADNSATAPWGIVARRFPLPTQ